MTDKPVYDIYARLSPNPEGSEKEVASADRQIRETSDWIVNQLGGQVGRVYRDDGISATKKNAKRDGFEATLRDLEPGSRLACWHIDRYIRTTRDLLRVLDVGFTVHSFKSGFMDLSTPAGIAVAKTIVAWAEYEGQQKSIRQQSSHMERAANGQHWWNHRPLGFNMDGTEVPGEAETVRRIYEAVLGGHTLSGIARDLNDYGITTAAGRPWTASAVRIIILSARNAGIITYRNQEIGRGNFATLVDESVYRAAVRIVTDPNRTSRGARGRRTNLLTGIATCGVCQGDVRVTGENSTGMKEQSYQCRKGHTSAWTRWVDDRVEAIILARLSGDQQVTDILREDESGDLASIHEDLRRAHLQLDELGEMFTDGDLTRDQFTSANRKVRDKIEMLQRSLAKTGLDSAVATILDVPDLKTHWRHTMTINQRHAFVRQFFDRIIINPRQQRGRMNPGDVEFYVPGFMEPVL